MKILLLSLLLVLSSLASIIVQILGYKNGALNVRKSIFAIGIAKDIVLILLYIYLGFLRG